MSQRHANLAIADPPYPPFIGTEGKRNYKPRASRWYGAGQLGKGDRPADQHDDASEWDDPARHRALLVQLCDTYDGWVIATSPDGLFAYGDLPAGVRIMSWVKPNGIPGSHRIRSMWEPVIVYPPSWRRSNRGGVGAVPDVLVADPPKKRFWGQKPPQWTHWVLRALSYDPRGDVVEDLFPGTGSVTRAIAEYQPQLW